MPIRHKNDVFVVFSFFPVLPVSSRNGAKVEADQIKSVTIEEIYSSLPLAVEQHVTLRIQHVRSSRSQGRDKSWGKQNALNPVEDLIQEKSGLKTAHLGFRSLGEKIEPVGPAVEFCRRLSSKGVSSCVLHTSTSH